ncbi:MAG: pyridoxamine 5'-phosphate oxidase [Kordiimonadaceae bacterium]|nr:pyridoxamine 5'-phosphate oxidase [Kordiimonadaceae bacterium]
MSKVISEYGKPFALVNEWVAEAEASEPNDPTAMSLATTTLSGRPSVRMVLLKGCDERGLVFYTNQESRKGIDLSENPNAALLFHWKSLRRQIRVEGAVELVSDAEADDYFASRPRASQIGAWASAQSRPMGSRFEFETAIGKYTAKFGIKSVPRPDYWVGYRLKPDYFEFWRDKKFRLHERKIFEISDSNSEWQCLEIYP